MWKFVEWEVDDLAVIFEHEEIPKVITAKHVKDIIKKHYIFASSFLDEWNLWDLMVFDYDDDDLDYSMMEFDIDVEVSDIMPNPHYSGDNVMFKEYLPSPIYGEKTKERIF